MPEITRRRLMAALPLAATALATMPATADPADPILAHFREWATARELWARLLITDDPDGNAETPEILAAEDREDAARHAIMAIEPTTPAAVAVYAALLWDHIGNRGDLREAIPGSPHGLESRLTAAIWRCATGCQTAPPEGDMANLGEAWPEIAATISA